MNQKSVKEELIKEIKYMPNRDIYAVAEFIGFLRERELDEEILGNRRIVSAIKRSQKAWKEGKTHEFIPWEELKKKYKL